MSRYLVSVVLILAASSAMAQERMFSVTLTEAQINYIGKVIAKQPYEDAYQVMVAIQTQVNHQLLTERAQAEELKKLKEQKQ